MGGGRINAMAQWQLQTAKQRFSEVIRAVEAGEPQFITKNGKEVAAVVNINDYRSTHEGSNRGLIDVLLAAPQILSDEEVEEYFARDKSTNEKRERELDEIFARH